MLKMQDRSGCVADVNLRYNSTIDSTRSNQIADIVLEDGVKVTIEFAHDSSESRNIVLLNSVVDVLVRQEETKTERYAALLSSILNMPKQLAYEKLQYNKELICILTELLESKLTSIENIIMRSRFGIGSTYSKTLRETAKEQGKSFEYIKKMELRAIRKLRHPEYKLKLLMLFEKSEIEKQRN